MSPARTPYPLRLPKSVREEAEKEAFEHRRSLNVELGILIEEALEKRKQARSERGFGR